MGVTADPDRATVSAVDISTTVGANEKIRMKVPYFTGALGSTDIVRIHWEPMAIAAAISGTLVVVGENVWAWIRKRNSGTGRWSNLRSWSDE